MSNIRKHDSYKEVISELINFDLEYLKDYKFDRVKDLERLNHEIKSLQLSLNVCRAQLQATTDLIGAHVDNVDYKKSRYNYIIDGPVYRYTYHNGEEYYDDCYETDYIGKRVEVRGDPINCIWEIEIVSFIDHEIEHEFEKYTVSGKDLIPVVDDIIRPWED